MPKITNSLDSSNFFQRLLSLFIFATLTFCLPFLYFNLKFAQNQEKNKDKIMYETAIVFGSGVTSDGNPGYTLTARLDEALRLYKLQKIKKILVSGDNRDKYYNEPKVMRQYLIDRGVLASMVTSDFGGLNTIDTCYRAKNYFKIEEAVLITQEFHLARSVFLCENFGMKVQTSASESRSSVSFYGTLREVPASIIALAKTKVNYQPEIKNDGKEVDFRKL